MRGAHKDITLTVISLTPLKDTLGADDNIPHNVENKVQNPI